MEWPLRNSLSIHMKFTPLLRLTVLAFAALTVHSNAGHQIADPKDTHVASDYEGGRGLLTVQRPSGLVINPTSGTLPEGAFTAQYCFFLPNNNRSVYMTHGAMAAYGVKDWLEVGAIFTARDNGYAQDQYSGGPLVRIRLLKDEGLVPQLSIGGYSTLGDLENYNAFLALYKRVVVDPQGVLRSVGFHAGIRETWIYRGAISARTGTYAKDVSDTPVGYSGIEFELPYRLYLVGEISTTDKDSGGNAMPYGFGVQWRAGGVNVSASFANPGNLNQPSFFFGIGSQLKF